MPEEFHEAMREAVSNLTSKLEELAVEEGIQVPATIEYLVNQSIRLARDHPYAAASYAYRALLGMYSIYYSMFLDSRGGGIPEQEISDLEAALSRLEGVLEKGESRGSIYYLEMRATAYTRLAEAYSSLQRAKELSMIGAPLDEVARLLATVKARVASIESWIDVSERLKGMGPVIDEGSLGKLEKGLYTYVVTSVNYSSSLIRYSIQNYALPDIVRSTLEVYLDSIQSILDKAVRYRENGNLVASIGFLREALSESLSTIFTLSATEGSEAVIKGYLEEIKTMYSVLLARIASKGYPGGLAPAYADYASVLLEEDPRAAVSLMEEAIASIILWNILAVTALSNEGVAPSPGLAGAIIPRALEDPVLTAIIALVSYSVGIVVSTLVARLPRRQ